MPDFDVFFLFWNVKKRKSRSHDKRKNGKICTEKPINTSLKDLSIALNNHGRVAFSFLSSLPISALRNFELEANKIYNRANTL